MWTCRLTKRRIQALKLETLIQDQFLSSDETCVTPGGGLSYLTQEIKSVGPVPLGEGGVDTQRRVGGVGVGLSSSLT